MRLVEAGAKRTRDQLKTIFSGGGGGFVFAGFGATLGLGLRKAFDAAVNREAIELRLKAMTSSVAEASREFQELRDLAERPGISLEGASDTFVRLRAVRIDADLAKRAVSEFGNALALVGGTDLSGVALALSQITAKGKVQAEEINQIAERVPQIRQVLKDAFGTANTEELQRQALTTDEFIRGVVDELAKLERAAPSTVTQIKNFKQAMADAGSSIGKNLLPPLTQAAQAVAGLFKTSENMTDGDEGWIVKAGKGWGVMAAAFAEAASEGKPVAEVWGDIADAIAKAEMAREGTLDYVTPRTKVGHKDEAINTISGAAGIMSMLPHAMKLGEIAQGGIKTQQEQIRKLTDETAEIMERTYMNSLSSAKQLEVLERRRARVAEEIRISNIRGTELLKAKESKELAELDAKIQDLKSKQTDYELARAPERESIIRDGQWLAEQAMSMVRLRQVDPFPGLSALDRAQGRIESGSQGMSLLDNTANTVRELRDLNDNLERLLTFK